ncbi:S16 family serine protease [Herbiconiux sp. KACC 21604]|uniref:YlbL family protein n=1 Tax=unclassified Herbiconiux TaxID=2618217 RepID=UPI001490A114|nr:S16 family serine protease [Herbiconiux sp. SALV-R1]QJU53915.1 PDZ domain-containing protein [Herbiconiux sp. SALV-R1]WPO84935.1 S16 family serine protease [Herbiconiux sp. KACC 21604]
MSLFEPAEGDPRPRPSRRARTGWTVLIIGLVLGLVMSFLPAPYVIEQPGPVFDTLGTQQHDGEDVPLISIEGAETYPTAGTLDMLTVSVRGTREQRPSWAEILTSWFDSSRAVLPIDSVYPPTVTTEQRNQENAALMVDSQQEAVAAALTHLDIAYETRVDVAAVDPDGPSADVLTAGDVILSVNGVSADDLEALRAALAENGTDAAASVLVRHTDGSEETLSIVPVVSEQTGAPAIGISVGYEYTFPFDVEIKLDDVGGPSAGMMFALGIIDRLTPGELNGGQNVAGTGTIDAQGNVGRIGGIRQKMFGARDAGATWFLAPAGNCDEVVGHVPDGIRVFAVSTLDDSIAVLDAISSGGDTSTLPTCDSVLAGQ